MAASADAPSPTSAPAAGHVLVVDDDGEIRRLVAKALREHGYRVTPARDGREMREALASGAIDLIVLDLMLPGTSGLELCREIRHASALPIIMLTARGDEGDRVLGLELGADDYLAKPFSSRELVARINAVLRRSRAPVDGTNTRGGHILAFEGWQLDSRRRELTNAEGAIVDLSTGEYDLLLTFLDFPQRVLSRDQLMDTAKGRIASGFDRAIDIQVSRLRRKIDPDGDGQRLIKTIRGQGYMFTAPVSRR